MAALSAGSHSMSETRPQMIAEGVPPYKIVEVNEAWLLAFGFDRDEVIGKTTKLMCVHASVVTSKI